MATYLRGVHISVEVDTNKATYRKQFNLEDYDSVEDLLKHIEDWIECVRQ